MMEKAKPKGRVSINLSDLSLQLIDICEDAPPQSAPPHCSGEVHSSELRFPIVRSLSDPSISKNRAPVMSLANKIKNEGTATVRADTKQISGSKPGRALYSRSSSLIENGEKVRKESAIYDPGFEKSCQFLKATGSSLTQTGQSLMPLKRGLKRVEVHYSATNVAQNNSLIFADLIRNAHKSNIIFQENVEQLERRLLTKRSDQNKATTFYDGRLIRPSTSPLRSTSARTVAGKKVERKKRIKKKSKKIELGYEPKAVSFDTKEDFEKILSCRYLRVDPKYQRELYEVDKSGLFE
ncbi:hypothetical protein SNE40_000954 [Patella caerulea]